jgi:hypothetical protein
MDRLPTAELIRRHPARFTLPLVLPLTALLLRPSADSRRSYGGLTGGRALAVGAVALGVFALGALAVGAIAVGAVAMGRVTIRDLRVQRLTVGEVDLPAPSSGTSPT